MFRLMAAIAMASALGSFSTHVLAAGDAERGKTKAVVCGACHGPNGNSNNPDWPKLAGQHAPYLVSQLKAFKSGVRNNPLMSPQATNLSDQDMLDLAAYFAAQQPK